MIECVTPTPEPELAVKLEADYRRGMRRKLVGAVLLAVISTGATFMGCVGQSFAYRQAKALEAISGELARGCK